ncbi:hypothetical protein [Neomoorella thermoacetica]|uniref:hypothetical protein n=1 Tax=Neomoorella thermoacetica TaxID=1525 RepID=UPI0009084019|nr:hypothetical protein [Moorella thermoacetica]APC08287.1 hypothetical protein MTJW_11210 [Moorella thermoacetica]
MEVARDDGILLALLEAELEARESMGIHDETLADLVRGFRLKQLVAERQKWYDENR